MSNKDQSKLAEAINHFIVNKYMQNICDIKSRAIKLYSTMPFTGAANISDAQPIAMIEDLAKFVETNFTTSKN